MPEVWRFLKKVWKFWKVNLTGSVFIALLIVVRIFVRSVAWWAYASIAVATLMMSCFFAWRDEYRSRLALENSRGEEWADLLGQAKVELSLRLEKERELEETKQQLADEKADKISVDEIVLREARKEFRNLTKFRDATVAPRQVLNDAWVKLISERNGITRAEILESIVRQDGKFHWQT